MNKTKLSMLATLILAGNVMGQARAATHITSVTAAPADIAVVRSNIAHHMLTKTGTLAAGTQTTTVTAANGHIDAGDNDVLSIKWNASDCTGFAFYQDECVAKGVTPGHTAAFWLAKKGGGRLTAVTGADGWFGTSAQKNFDYVVMLLGGQNVLADRYKLVVDAGVVTP